MRMHACRANELAVQAVRLLHVLRRQVPGQGRRLFFDPEEMQDRLASVAEQRPIRPLG
jgi:hypothetical protein